MLYVNVVSLEEQLHFKRVLQSLQSTRAGLLYSYEYIGLLHVIETHAPLDLVTLFNQTSSRTRS